MSFQRGLKASFLAELVSGPGRPILEACQAANLDLRIRNNYVNAYRYGQSVAKINGKNYGASLEIHRKYLSDDQLQKWSGNGNTRHIRVDGEVAREFATDLPDVIRRASAHSKREDKIEWDLVRQNVGDTFLQCIDRQAQFPGSNRSRLDVVAVSSDPPQFVCVEIKGRGDPKIAGVADQTHRYLEMFDPDEAGLRADVADSYRTVARQLPDLGMPAPDPEIFQAGMPVVGLVVIYKNNHRSKLLGRAQLAARNLSRPIWLWLPEDELVIPPHTQWSQMGKP